MSKTPVAQFKIVIVGMENVGKTCFLRRFVDGTYQENYLATIGVDFATRTCTTTDGELIKLQAWDTAGQERFRTITTSYYRGAEAVLLMYDVTDRKTFERIPEWLNEVNEQTNEIKVLFLVGNKADTDSADDHKREVSPEEGWAFAKEHDLAFCESSAKDDLNVNNIFQSLSDLLLANHREQHEGTKDGFSSSTKNKKKRKPVEANNVRNKEKVVLDDDGNSQMKKRRTCLI